MANQGFGGLINMGNTCYANATLQAIRHCTKVPWIFEKGRFDSLFRAEPSAERAKHQALALSFGEIVTLLGRCRRGQRVRPADFWAKFGAAVHDTGFEHLAAKMPHDSHEFYLFMLDSLHEAMAQEVSMKITRPPPNTEAERHCVQALETWKREFEKKYSPLVDLFYGLQHITVRCKGCGTCSHRWEVFSALKAQVPAVGPPPTLAEMLAEEFKPETIEGYACDKCAPTRTEAEKSVRLWRMPLHVVIVLKRFTFDGRKISTPCTAVPEGFSFAPFFSEESPERSGATTYSVHSIVDHHGGMNGGHYTVQCREANEWLIYDDESTGSAPQLPVYGSSTYMLFMTRGTEA